MAKRADDLRARHALPPHKPGRRLKWSSELQHELCRYLEDGIPVHTACGLVGINPDTYHAWVKRGESGEELFAEFAETVVRAETQCRCS
jgi:hypothetical protein